MITAGAVCFGVVIGWITYRTLRRTTSATALTDLSTVIGVIGGGAITGIFKDEFLFASYSIGLAIGFFLYFIISLILDTLNANVGNWMGD